MSHFSTYPAVLSVKPLQKVLQPLPRFIRSLPFLAGHVVVDEAAADLGVENIIVQASLENAIPKMHAHNVALLGVVNLKFSGLFLLVFSILKLTGKNQILLNIVEKVMRRGIFP